ncbi:mucoidy inhibitor MuiA family protein [Mucilaginibacter achroorhodeus]|uniref:Mucoidy inhibitor MuiA family protein n=1 Tax=Mucilaginibacter achroorhodeus TaxID=2599294 RepID=A0A563U1F6_9SPHI|nr:mucoidy inhibitor MuiA family protein [Mucilaginibacter achroorhodeus]TWR24681.1 mucoidy inhibitor MuiA family protein [Mucilaginibacter achroorhodeus]
MIKKLLLITCLLIVLKGIASADDSQKIISQVQKVTLFLNGAQVTRTALTTIPAGTSTLVFENISPNIDVQSIQVKGAGNFTILAVKHEMNYLNLQNKQKQIEGLQADQKKLHDKMTLLNASLNINQEEYNMLVKNQTITGQNANLDVLKLKQALDFQTARLTENKKKEQAINDQISELNKQLQRYDKQIADILKSKGNSDATSDILVTVSAKAPVQSAFKLTYLVNNASWYPTYDIRAKDVNSPISISYKANVTQQSGEDWKNIKLTLSTGNPTISGSKPELKPYFLNYNMYYAGQQSSITRVQGNVADNQSVLPGVSVKVKGTSIGTVTDAGGNYSLQIPNAGAILQYNFLGYEQQERPVTSAVMNISLQPSANQLNEVVVAAYSSERIEKSLQGKAAGMTIQIRGNSSAASNPVEVQQTENQTNVEFNIANPYSIPSDGKQYSVAINDIDTKASYQYYSAPKLSTDVFLTAQLTDWNKYNFLSGEANLFFEGTFIGKSLIDVNATNDTLNLSLGVDKNIIVTRTLQKDLTEKQALSSNRKETRDWLISIKNRKSQPVDLLIEDQIPVSQNSGIEVDQQEVSGGKLDKETGKLSYAINLNSQDEKKLRIKYQVKYPKNSGVIVQ